MARYGIRRWDPFGELMQLHDEVSNVLESTGWGLPFLAERGGSFPRVNIWTDEQKSTLYAEVPGVDMQDLEVTVVGTTLTLKGERKPASEVASERHYRHERGYGPFGRSVQLPHKVDVEKVAARLDDGILTVQLPKAPEVKPRKITVKS